MNEIDPYIRVLLLRSTSDLMEASGHFRREEIAASIRARVHSLLMDYNGDGITDVAAFVENMIDEMIKSEALGEERQRFAGDYIVYNTETYRSFRSATLRENKINQDAARIGNRFFSDVFGGYQREQEGAADSFPDLGLAPASNRTVTFTDNQINELDELATGVIDAVAAQNQIDENPGLRELIVGQLKAGRELIRAGTFRLYVIEITLIETLKFLAKRYEREAIGGLAAALITALLKHMGIDA
jgi:hypothetical protein